MGKTSAQRGPFLTSDAFFGGPVASQSEMRTFAWRRTQISLRFSARVAPTFSRTNSPVAVSFGVPSRSPQKRNGRRGTPPLWARSSGGQEPAMYAVRATSNARDTGTHRLRNATLDTQGRAREITHRAAEGREASACESYGGPCGPACPGCMDQLGMPV